MKKNIFKKLAFSVTALLLATAILIPITQGYSINDNIPKTSDRSEQDFSITLHRIKEEDEIDPWPHGEPDWQLRMYVNGERKDYECVGQDVLIDKTFIWHGVIQEEDDYINIKMELLERDSGIWPDLHDIADISACIDWYYEEGDYDNTEDFNSHRPAVFKRTYNLISDQWEPVDDDNDYLNIEPQPPLYWYVTSGNYDGSTTVDENDATVWFNISIGNTPPYPPEKPMGIDFGWQGMIYDFSTKGYDIDGDQIQFAWDWEGDGDIDELTGFYDSWETCNSPHVWTQGRIYYVKVMAIDERGMPSEWSEPLKVRINAPGGINGMEVEEWTLGHIVSVYYNHEKTQEIISILRAGGNIVTAIATLVTAIATACGIPIPYAVVFTVVSAIIRLGVEVLNMMDQGMGIYVRHYLIEIAGYTVSDFCYAWSQTAEGYEGEPPAGNKAPDKPEKPQGRTIILPWRKYSYSTITADPDNDDITYIFMWGDGKYDCSDIKSSNEKVSMSHTWDESGSYEIRVKAVDNWGFESEWSEPLTITMSKNRGGFSISFFEILEKIMFRISMIKQNLLIGSKW